MLIWSSKLGKRNMMGFVNFLLLKRQSMYQSNEPNRRTSKIDKKIMNNDQCYKNQNFVSQYLKCIESDES